MTLADLKGQIESKTLSGDLIVFQIDKDDFIPTQYIREMSLVTGREVEYLSEIDSLCTPVISIFGEEHTVPTTLRVFTTDVLDCSAEIILKEKFLVIVTKEIDKNSVDLFKNSTIIIPKLSDWQIKDYVYSLAEGVSTKDLDWLISLFSNNLYRLENELTKLSIFTENERDYLFKDLKTDGAYSDVSQYNIFNLSNALSVKDVATVMRLYDEMEKMGVSEFGLLAILLKTFKNIMMVQTQNTPTAEYALMDSKQFYAINKLPKVYTREQLMKIFMFLSDIDRQVKSGELPTDIMIDYMIIKILSM